ncbi:cation transporter [Oceanospirillum beijerinckii]|uniref:cation transporter n=1 Tax=Oceanospirillum beijerinckii TaxID=64976 RepID=UPI00042080B0|nr:cation transporter [Oceanospirillum beijerinckii]MAC45721.1 heavy metal transport/detoxification protein [Oceanospirillum sp.]
MSKEVVLTLEGLSCNGCVNSVTEALIMVDGVEQADVTLYEAIVTGDVDPQVLIDAVEEAGFDAEEKK